jgi:uncharacterized protein involved in exopolysaccharide biosynthesis
MKSFRLMAVGVFLLVAGGILVATAFSMLLQRDEFKSAAMVQVYPPPSSPNTYDPYFLLTEFQTFQSHAVLTDVIASLNLRELWSKKYNHGQTLSDSEIEEMIKRHLELRNVRNTKFIEIGVYDDDPLEAAQLANAIARSYCRLRTEQIQRLASEVANSSGPLKFQPPEIINSAVPQMRPVRPNRYLAWAMLGCGVILMIGGIISLKSRES